MAGILPKLLVVDDEPAVISGLALTLGNDFAVHAATNGEAALRKLVAEGPFAIVLADHRMPGMDGATLLARVRGLAPDTVRVLLTGYADVDSAVAAVHSGQVFRFLTKPCPTDQLRRALLEAFAQHRLMRAERELLERTLRGAVQALAEVLALTEPDAFGRAGRVQRLALQIAEALHLDPRWPLELAALLSQIGTVSLPREVVRKLRTGEKLEPAEESMAARMPEVTDKLLGPIPRLEPVREILRLWRHAGSGPMPKGSGEETRQAWRAASILRVADDFDLLEARGQLAAIAFATMRKSGVYAPEPLAALEQIVEALPADRYEVRELPLSLLQVGMVLADDLRNRAGLLLAPRGSEITASFVERARNFLPGAVREPIRVMLQPAPIAPAPPSSPPLTAKVA